MKKWRSSALFRLLPILRGHWGLISLTVLLAVLTISSSIGLLSLGAWIISAAALRPSIAELQVAIVGVRFFGLTRGIFRYLERLLSHRVSLTLLAEMRSKFYSQLEKVAPARLQDIRSGDLLSRLSADIETLQDFFVRVMAPPGAALIITAVMILSVASIHPLPALILMAGYFASGLILPLIMIRMTGGLERDVTEQQSALQSTWLDLIQGHTEVTSFNASERMIRQIKSLSTSAEDKKLRLGGYESAEAGWMLVITRVIMMAVMLAAFSHTTPISLAAIALGVAASFEAMTPLPQAARQLKKGEIAAQRILDILNAPPPVEVPVAGKEPRGSSLMINHLTFSYPDSQANALSNFSMEVQEGEHVAIIGPSGAGKSTLTNLLLRFWEYDKGTIRFGDLDLKEISEEIIRERITAITQDSTLFNLTIRENLQLANRDASDSMLEQAMEEVLLEGLLNTLPMRLDSRVGEGGARISGGERQRLMLARMFLKGGDLFILDEPTSHIDAITEAKILTMIERKTRGRTMIMITHRLVGLELMDRIFLMRNGRVIEEGTHDQLMAIDSYYRKLRLNWETSLK